MTDSPTHGCEHGKGRRAEYKREAISLCFLTEKLSPKRLQLGQFITPMNNSRGCVQGFVLFFSALSTDASHLRSHAQKRSVKQPLDLMVEKEARDGLSLGGVTARCFSLKPPHRSALSDGPDNALFL